MEIGNTESVLLLNYRPPEKRVDIRHCFACGCSELHACPTVNGPCYWVAWDLCSACLFDFAIQHLARQQRIGTMLGKMPASALARWLMREIGYIEKSTGEAA